MKTNRIKDGKNCINNTNCNIGDGVPAKDVYFYRPYSGLICPETNTLWYPVTYIFGFDEDDPMVLVCKYDTRNWPGSIYGNVEIWKNISTGDAVVADYEGNTSVTLYRGIFLSDGPQSQPFSFDNTPLYYGDSVRIDGKRYYVFHEDGLWWAVPTDFKGHHSCYGDDHPSGYILITEPLERWGNDIVKGRRPENSEIVRSRKIHMIAVFGRKLTKTCKAPYMAPDEIEMIRTLRDMGEYEAIVQFSQSAIDRETKHPGDNYIKTIRIANFNIIIECATRISALLDHKE